MTLFLLERLRSGSAVDLIEVDELITTSDFISVHTPLVAATRGLLNDESLQRCKRGVGIINCARGGIVDEAALLRALESGQVGGAGLDVYSSEPSARGPATITRPS